MTSFERTRTVLITSSTSGIGAATASVLGADGWHVVVTGRDVAGGESVVAAIEADAGRTVFVRSDLTAASDELRAFARAATAAAGGQLDAVVHNAAVCPAVDTVALSDADLEDTLAVNIRAPHVLTAALAPAMATRGDGAIVVIGPWMAHVGHAFVGLYSEQRLPKGSSAQLGDGVWPEGRAGQHRFPGGQPAPLSTLRTVISSRQ